MEKQIASEPRRIVLTLPADVFAALQARAQQEMRPTKTQALKLLLDALKVPDR